LSTTETVESGIVSSSAISATPAASAAAIADHPSFRTLSTTRALPFGVKACSSVDLHPDLLGLVWLRSSSLQRGPDVFSY
jgi:hypothetical protein